MGIGRIYSKWLTLLAKNASKAKFPNIFLNQSA